MSNSDYVKERLDDQINWYSKNARHNKLRFRFYQLVTLIGSATIPIVNVLNFDLSTRIISSVIGGMIVVITGVSQLEKYQENWVLYRSTAELLRREKYFFMNDVDEYTEKSSESDKKKLLVQRVEAIISGAISRYFTIYESKKGQVPNNTSH